MPKNYWLKPIKGEEDTLPDAWVEARPDLLKQVRFWRRPSDIKMGELIIYYADRRLVAIVSAGEEGRSLYETHSDEEPGRSWALHVNKRKVVERINDAPSYEVLGIDSKSVRTQSHLRLNEAEFKRGEAAIDEVLVR